MAGFSEVERVDAHASRVGDMWSNKRKREMLLTQTRREVKSDSMDATVSFWVAAGEAGIFVR